MTIRLPKGYKPPTEAKPGEPFEVVAVLAASEDGSFMIKTLDGVTLDEPEMEDEEPEQPEMENPEMENPMYGMPGYLAETENQPTY